MDSHKQNDAYLRSYSQSKICAAVTGMALVAGAWAYFSSTSTIDNKLKTGDGYGSKTVEEFTPYSDRKSVV